MTYQVQEFGLCLMGMGIVTGLASTAAAAMRGAAGAYTAAAASVTAAAAKAADPQPTAASSLVGQSLNVATASVMETVYTVDVGDIKGQLQEAADEALAAVQRTAYRPRSPPAVTGRSAGASVPNGTAVRPGMTVEEATKQVKEWIEAWRDAGSSDEQPAEVFELPALGSPGVPLTTRVTEPSLPPNAAAVLSALTADAPIANTPTGGEVVGIPAAPQAAPEGGDGGRQLVTAAAAVAAPAGQQGTDVEREAAYKARIADVKADLPVFQSNPQQQLQAREAAARRKTVEVGPGYESKIAGLWANYEEKKAKEQELLAKSNRILSTLAQLEAEEQLQMVAAPSAAPEPSALSVPGPATTRALQRHPEGLLPQLAAIFKAVLNFLQLLIARLTGGGSSGGTPAGASA